MPFIAADEFRFSIAQQEHPTSRVFIAQIFCRLKRLQPTKAKHIPVFKQRLTRGGAGSFLNDAQEKTALLRVEGSKFVSVKVPAAFDPICF
jgi:hypothetical protein